MAKATAERVMAIESASLEPAEKPVTSSSGYEIICSYTWVRNQRPTIFVPGKKLEDLLSKIFSQ
jgi:hypothetical protein